jgi:hypothetical protein
MNANPYLYFDGKAAPQPFCSNFLRDKKSDEVVHVINRLQRLRGYHNSAIETKHWDYFVETISGETKTLQHENLLENVARNEIVAFERGYSRVIDTSSLQ